MSSEHTWGQGGRRTHGTRVHKALAKRSAPEQRAVLSLGRNHLPKCGHCPAGLREQAAREPARPRAAVSRVLDQACPLPTPVHALCTSFLGYHDKGPQTTGLKTTEIYSPTFWGQKPEIEVWAGPRSLVAPGEGPSCPSQILLLLAIVRAPWLADASLQSPPWCVSVSVSFLIRTLDIGFGTPKFGAPSYASMPSS